MNKLKILGLICVTSTLSISAGLNPCNAQSLESHDPSLAPYIKGDNSEPKEEHTDYFGWLKYTPPINITSPWGWGLKVWSYPNSAGIQDETRPDDPLDTNSDGVRDSSISDYPSTWTDSNNDGLYDSCGYSVDMCF